MMYAYKIHVINSKDNKCMNFAAKTKEDAKDIVILYMEKTNAKSIDIRYVNENFTGEHAINTGWGWKIICNRLF